MDNSSASQSATKVVEDTATPKMQPPGKTVPSLADRTIPPENLGIKIRFKPINEEDINIDILAVPGIGTDPESTWTYSKYDPQDTRTVNWLSDSTMLPALFPNARIMTFGYDSIWFGDAPPRQRLSGIADKVLKELTRNRKECRRRPILLIGHCFGGLVMQQVYLRSQRNTSDYPGTYDSITGMIFLGTPHQGSSSSIATMGSLADIYEMIRQQNFQTEDNLLKTVAQDNETLVDTVADFTREIKQRTAGPEIFCFFEERSTPVFRIVGLKDRPLEFVVNETSGCLTGYGRLGLSTNHFNINKFGSDKDNNYISVVEELQKMAEKTEDLMKQRRGATHANLAGSGNISGTINEQTGLEAHKSIPMLPFSVAKGFAPRDSILKKVKSHFDHSSKVVLVGACGSGKTHVAVEYADGFRKENPEAKIYCVNASNAADFELSYHLISDKLKLKPGRKGNILGAVRDYLTQGESNEWLMIVDGFDQDRSIDGTDKKTGTMLENDPDPLQSILDYIPDGHPYGGQVLVTTRSKRVATRVINNHKYIVELKSLTKDDALQLLRAGSKSKPSSPTSHQPKIVDAVHGSAGALALVRAYKETSGGDFSWKDLWNRIQASTNDNVGLSTQVNEQVRPILGIWMPLYAHLQRNHHEAADLLHKLCRLDVQSIPVFLIDSNYDDKSQRDEYKEALRKYDMLEISVNRRDARVTPMIRLLANSTVRNKSDDADFFDGAALKLVCDAFPPPLVEDNIKCRALKPCAFAALQLELESAVARRQKAQLLFRLGAYERRVRNQDGAVKLLEQCLELCKGCEKRSVEDRRLEKDAKKLLENTRKDLLKSSRRRSREKDGSQSASHDDESPERKAIIISPESKADEVRSMSQAVLGAHRRAGCMEDNIKRQKQILAWHQANFGAQHQDTARQQFNLALELDANDEHAEAEKLYLEAIKTMESIYGRGSTNADLLRMQSSLARRHGQQRRLKESEDLFTKVLEGQTESLGRDHPHTLATRMNIALLVQELRPGDLESPGAELQSVLAAQTRLLGQTDPATLKTASNLAQNYRLRGRISDAEPLFTLSLDGQIKSLGEKHPDTMTTMTMLKELENETEVH